MLTFPDEADAINEQVQILKRQNVHAIVVLLHQGAFENSYTGPTPTTPARIPPLTSADPLMKILNDLDDEVDVVITGHTHSFSNALVKNKNGATFLVTREAYPPALPTGDIELGIDPRTRNVVSKSASIITTYADAGPGLRPDPAVTSLVSAASGMVAPLTSQPVGTAAADLTRTQNSAGESPLGDLIADSQRAAMGTDFAFMNPGGIRADIAQGSVTWGQLYAVQPFNNILMKITLTGQQIYDVLNQQWTGGNASAVKILQISGLTYTWKNNQVVGSPQERHAHRQKRQLHRHSEQLPPGRRRQLHGVQSRHQPRGRAGGPGRPGELHQNPASALHGGHRRPHLPRPLSPLLGAGHPPFPVRPRDPPAGLASHQSLIHHQSPAPPRLSSGAELPG